MFAWRHEPDSLEENGLKCFSIYNLSLFNCKRLWIVHVSDMFLTSFFVLHQPTFWRSHASNSAITFFPFFFGENQDSVSWESKRGDFYY